MPEIERSASGYRLYGDGAVERLRFIKRTQRFGLRLEAIGQLLDVRQRGLCPCGHTRRLLEDRVAELDGRFLPCSPSPRHLPDARRTFRLRRAGPSNAPPT